MQIGILGTGIVAQTLGSKLVELGHDVRLGSRTADNEKAARWVKTAGPRASQGAFADTAESGEILFNCTAGVASLAALAAAGQKPLAGKTLIDVANPLDFSRGMPPSLTVCNTDSLGEQIQRAFPGTSVVKVLNTVTADLMVNPSLIPGDHDLFMCGNDADAKAAVAGYLREWFGWRTILDLGDITAARATEMYLPLWVRLYGLFGTPHVTVHVQHRATQATA